MGMQHGQGCSKSTCAVAFCMLCVAVPAAVNDSQPINLFQALQNVHHVWPVTSLHRHLRFASCSHAPLEEALCFAQETQSMLWCRPVTWKRTNKRVREEIQETSNYLSIMSCAQHAVIRSRISCGRNIGSGRRYPAAT